jgi:hypothetical protein
MKKIITSIVLLGALSTLSAQDPVKIWDKCYGGTGDDVANAITKTTDGGFIIAGAAKSSNGDVTGHIGTTSYSNWWIVKIDSVSNIQWQKSIGSSGAQNDIASAVQQVSDGGYIVGGRGSLSFAKLDNTGNVEWQKSTNPIYAVLETTDGSYLAVGAMNYDSRFYIVKYDVTGNVLWEKNYGASSQGGTYKTIAYSVKQTPDGGYILAGSAGANGGDITGNHSSSNDYWIVKLDANGNLEWQKCLGSTSKDIAYSIATTNDGGYIVAGEVNLGDGDVVGFNGPQTIADAWIVKLDNTGSIEWQKIIGTSAYAERAYSISQTADGGYIVGVEMPDNGAVNARVIKLDANGNNEGYYIMPYVRVHSALGNFIPVIETGTDEYVVAGSTNSSSFYSISGYHSGGGTYDYYVLKLKKILPPAAPTNLVATFVKAPDAVVLSWTDNSDNEDGFRVQRSTNGGASFMNIATLGVNVTSYSDNSVVEGTEYWYRVLSYNAAGSAVSSVVQITAAVVGISENTMGMFHVFPNPASEMVTIFNIPQDTSVEICDLTGKTVFSSMVSEDSVQIDVSTAVNGVYFVKVSHNGTVSTEKLVIQK